MEKFIEALDELFDKYEVEEADRARIGDLLAGMGGELNNEGEDDFAVPSMGDEEDGNDEEDEFED